MAASQVLSYRGISEDLKYFAITQSLQNDVLTVFVLDCREERLLQTEYLFAKAVFIILGISAKLSKVQLSLVHQVHTRNCSAFLL